MTYIVIFLALKSYIPVLFAIPFALIYVLIYTSSRHLDLNTLTFATAITGIANIFLASAFILEKDIRLYYIFFSAGPILFIVLDNEYKISKIALSVGSIALIVLFELIPETEKLTQFSENITVALKTITLIAVGIQIMIPLGVYSHQISANESLFYNKSIIDPLTGLHNREYLSTYSVHILAHLDHPFRFYLITCSGTI